MRLTGGAVTDVTVTLHAVAPWSCPLRIEHDDPLTV